MFQNRGWDVLIISTTYLRILKWGFNMRREKLETAKHCECGCGELPKPGNRFVHGHNGKFASFSEVTINKALQTKKERKAKRRSIGQPCECGCGKWTSPYRRFISGHNMKGKTKENHSGLASKSEKIKGRTKETHPYLTAMAWRKGRTKNDDAGIASQARKMTGRTKENHPGRAIASQKLVGRTKENDSGRASQAEKMTGRTKENHPGIAAQAEKMYGSGNSMYGKCGPLSPSWQGGITNEPYCQVWGDKEYKEDIKARDNYQCQNPDCWKNEFKDLLVIHHINYNKKDCIPSNLITLCRSCNMRANFNRDFWQNFYSCIVETKQVVNL